MYPVNTNLSVSLLPRKPNLGQWSRLKKIRKRQEGRSHWPLLCLFGPHSLHCPYNPLPGQRPIRPHISCGFPNSWLVSQLLDSLTCSSDRIKCSPFLKSRKESPSQTRHREKKLVLSQGNKEWSRGQSNLSRSGGKGNNPMGQPLIKPIFYSENKSVKRWCLLNTLMDTFQAFFISAHEQNVAQYQDETVTVWYLPFFFTLYYFIPISHIRKGNKILIQQGQLGLVCTVGFLFKI